MNTRKGLFLIFLVMAGELGAQNISDMPANSFPFNLSGNTMMRFDNRYEGVKGTYTFFETFNPGTVILKKDRFNGVLLNYDAYSDILLAKSEKIEGAVELRKDMITNFTLKNAAGDEEFLFVKKTIDSGPVFLWQFLQDSITFYCKVGKKIKKADIGGAYNTSEKRYDEFVTVNTFYVDKGTNELLQIQSNKKGLLKAFPEYEAELSTYLKKGKVDFDDYDQMKAVAMYINSLKKKQS